MSGLETAPPTRAGPSATNNGAAKDPGAAEDPAARSPRLGTDAPALTGARDANSKERTIGRYATEDEAARAVNAAIRRAGLEGKRNINTVDATTIVATYRAISKDGAADAIDGAKDEL